MLDSNKWNIYRILMIVISILYITIRIIGLIYNMRFAPSILFPTFFFQILTETIFLAILIFIPRNYRMLVMIPLLYFCIYNIAQIITFVNTFSLTNYPTLFVIQFISTRIINFITYFAFLVMLLPIFKYQIKHVFIAALFIIPAFLLYLLNIVQMLGYLDSNNILELLFGAFILNFIVFLSIPTIFTLYILNDVKSTHEPKEEMN